MKYELGDTVDDFELPNFQGTTKSLSDGLDSSENIMLVFFRGFW